MTHLKLDDKYARNRKIARLSDAAFRLHTTALLHVAEIESDGVLEPMDLDMLPHVPTGTKLAAGIRELVSGGLWEPIESGWQMHDWLDWNKSHAELEAEREKARGRMARVRGRVRPNVRPNKRRTNAERSGEVLPFVRRPPARASTPAPAPARAPLSLNPSGSSSFSLLPDPDPTCQAKSARATGKRWRRVPETWEPSAQHRAIAAKRGVDFELELATFRDHEFGRALSDADAAFRNWLRKARPSRPVNRAEATARMLFETCEEIEREERARETK